MPASAKIMQQQALFSPVRPLSHSYTHSFSKTKVKGMQTTVVARYWLTQRQHLKAATSHKMLTVALRAISTCVKHWTCLATYPLSRRWLSTNVTLPVALGRQSGIWVIPITAPKVQMHKQGYQAPSAAVARA